MNIGRAGSSLHPSRQWRQRWPHGCSQLPSTCVLLLLALPCQSQLAPKFCPVVVAKGQRKEFLHKIKSRNVTLAILLSSRFCFHFAVISFAFTHSQRKFYVFYIFSLFCKVLCGFFHWLCLFLWAVFSFFFCAHKWLLSDCTNCVESTCCSLYCNTVALMMSHPSICFTLNSVQASWGISVGVWRRGSLKGLTHGNVTFVCHSFSS